MIRIEKAAVVAIAMFLVLGMLSQAQAGQRSNQNRAYDSLVQLLVDTRFGTTRRVSGFIVNANGYVLTSYHGISDAERIRVLQPSAGVYEVTRILRVNKKANFAMVAMANATGTGIETAHLTESNTVKAGDKVYIFHHPLFAEDSLSRARISAVGYPSQLTGSSFLETTEQDRMLFKLDGSFDPGSAGGMVCNETYDVIGILVAGSGNTAYALASSAFNDMLISTADAGWSRLQTDATSDAEYFNGFFGPAPGKMDYSAPMPEGYLMWFAPIHPRGYNDKEFTREITDKIQQNWFHSSKLEIDGKPLREYSASRIFVWEANLNPWQITDGPEQYVHFDADSFFKKRVYTDRQSEERIMTRHLLAMPLAAGEHIAIYENVGAGYKTTGTKAHRFTLKSAAIEMLDISGLSFVSMRLLPSGTPGVGEGERVKYELERRPLGVKEVMHCLRMIRFPVEW